MYEREVEVIGSGCIRSFTRGVELLNWPAPRPPSRNTNHTQHWQKAENQKKRSFMAVKILVADDEPVIEHLIRHYFSKQIRQQNLAFTFVQDGLQALEQVGSCPDIDIILCDISMPGMDGLTLLSRIGRINSSIKTIIISAHGDIRHIRMAMNRGAFDFLTKPLDFDDLERTMVRAVRQLLQLREAQNMIVVHRQQIEDIAAASVRFVPREFLRLLGKESLHDVHLGEHIQREMSILFSDICDFTSMSEHLTPQENFNFINSFLSRVSPVIREHGGFIDKYVGDGIMALFPGQDFPGQADDAIDAAVAMQHAVVLYNQHRSRCGYQPIQIGIGIHTGSVMLGTIGEVERMEGTVISDAVNLASRLERLTRLYGAAVIVSDRTLLSLTRQFPYHLRFLDKVKVKGKQKAVRMFEILDDRMEDIARGKLTTLPDFEQGVLYYQNERFQMAAWYFQQVLLVDPTDRAAYLYLQRATYFLEYGVPVGWEGIEVLTDK
jgi:two-component system sensor histidine kinase ChiS